MDGSISSDPRELAVMANDFYSNLYASEGTIGMEEVLSHIPHRVEAALNSRLNACILRKKSKKHCFKCSQQRHLARTDYQRISFIRGFMWR